MSKQIDYFFGLSSGSQRRGVYARPAFCWWGDESGGGDVREFGQEGVEGVDGGD